MLGVCCDATGMFTNLPHNRTLLFLDALCGTTRDLGITELSVRRTGCGGVFAGPPPDKNTFFRVTLTLLREMVRFDIE